MLTLLRQEGYKVIKGKALWVSLILLFGFQLLIAIGTKQFNFMTEKQFITSSGASDDIIEIMMVVIASTIITNEFVHKTIKNLLSRQYSRLQVFLSKLITLVWMYVVLVFVNYLFTLVLKAIFFSSTEVTAHMIHQTVHYGIGLTLYVFIITSFVVLISNVAKSSGASIGIGVASIFVTQILATVISILIAKASWVKYNPFNFFLVESQYKTAAIKQLTSLNLNAMTVGTLLYGLLFLIIAYIIFNKRNI
ncbi:ABC transporter permease [Lactobacillus sp. Sy-1]|uniref:ABC transporter permease n=1 Tax=Lactobacillus sp. Sy-1 TaxID=2109645 RepID=UPI001C5A355C|nr:ABC transporter permease [Lactobacillus sp. Sy-1]MBW1605128.1 ABC transporter permease [Lactobacillus sp. Sy-1]